MSFMTAFSRGNDVEELRRQDGYLPKKTKNSWLRILMNQAKEFCLSTGLHGYKYIGQTRRSKIERIIWGLAVLASMCSAFVLMWFAWEYNAAHPTITVIESTHHGIWNYPFPAVTVCDNNRVSRSLAQTLVSNLKTLNNESEDSLVEEMRLLNELLDPGVFGYDVRSNLTHLQDIFDLNNLSIPQVIGLVTKNCSSLISACEWEGRARKCDDLFEQIMSRDGLCCSFNYFGVNKPQNPPDEKPRRVTACGYQTGLTMLVNPEPEDYLVTLFGAYGMKIMIHDPFHYPDHNAENKLVGIGLEVFMSVSPERTYSTPEVRNLPINKRECVFWDEAGFTRPSSALSGTKNLEIAQYSYMNCLTECRAATIKAKCHCIPYYFPQNGTRVCDLKDVECTEKYKSWYETSWPGMKVTSDELPQMVINGRSRPCGCIPDCRLHIYPLESSFGNFNREHFYNHDEFFNGVEMKNHSMVHVFFSDLVSTQYRRDVYYNWHNLFASFGGLLGLFAGFSLMSGFELFYFFTIRLIADICMKKKTITK